MSDEQTKTEGTATTDGLNEQVVDDVTENTVSEKKIENLPDVTAEEPKNEPEAINYDFSNLKLPEGFELDTNAVEKFTPLGRELGLSQEQAEKLANLYAEMQQTQAKDMLEKFGAFKKQQDDAVKLNYENLLNTDKEIGGGDKDKMNAYLDVADVGYSSFATDELKILLQNLHLDFHPAVIKHFYRLGKLCGNDKILPTGRQPGVKQNAADIIYGTDNN